MNKIIKTSIKIVLSLLILIVLLYNLNLSQLISTLSNFNWMFLPFLIIIFIISLIIGGLNNHVLLLALNEKIKFFKVVFYYITSWAYGLIVPGKIGEFSIIYFFKKEGVSVGKGTLVAILVKVITFLCFFVISLFGILNFFSFKDSMIILSLVVLSLIVFFLLLVTRTGRRFIKRFFLRKYSKLFSGFSENMYYVFREKKQVILMSFVLVFLKLLVTSLFVWLSFVSFGVVVSFYQVLIVTSTTIIVSLIPISIGGLGVRESTAVVLFLQYGIMSSLSAAVFFFYAIVRYVIAAIFAIYYVIGGWGKD